MLAKKAGMFMLKPAAKIIGGSSHTWLGLGLGSGQG